MTLERKSILCFAAIALSCILLTGTGLFSAFRLGSELDDAVVRIGFRSELANGMKNDVLTLRLAQRGMLLFSSINNKEKLTGALQMFEKTESGIRRRITDLRGTSGSEESGALVRKLESNLDAYAAVHRETQALCEGGQPAEAIAVDAAKAVALGTGMTNAAEGLLEIHKKEFHNAKSRADQVRTNTKIWLGVLVTIALGVCSVAGWTVRRLGRSLRSVGAALSGAVSEIDSAARHTTARSEELAARASQQAASVEETSASTQEIAAITRQNAESAREAVSLTQEDDRIGTEVTSALRGLEEAVEKINTNSASVARVIKVIDEIAFQTNILALNAAVEAARAGDAGMGFAVVAEEVRNLAQRSAEAARETTEIIGVSVESANFGKQRLAVVSKTFAQSSALRNQVRRCSEQVAAASDQQNIGVEQIATTMDDFARLTQSTATQAEEGVTASRHLGEQSQILQQAIGQLDALIGTRGR